MSKTTRNMRNVSVAAVLVALFAWCAGLWSGSAHVFAVVNLAVWSIVLFLNVLLAAFDVALWACVYRVRLQERRAWRKKFPGIPAPF